MLGGINTAVLIGSSLTMALAVHAAQVGERRQLIRFLAGTLGLGLVFLGIKAIEYAHKFAEHLVPGSRFVYEGPHAPQVQLFLSFYFGMTGMHALHMLIGIGLLSVLVRLAWRGRFSPDVLHAGGDHRPVLAFCRYCVDFSLSPALSSGTALMAQHIVSRALYYRIFAALLVLTLLTVGMASSISAR